MFSEFYDIYVIANHPASVVFHGTHFESDISLVIETADIKNPERERHQNE